MLQLTYWVDVPDQGSSQAAEQAFANAKSKAAQTISGIGEDVFFNKGRLTFKKGDVYVTVEGINTSVDTTTSAGLDQQIETEKQIAADILGRLPELPF